jgi:polar amino acid transport system substrate-binding protein
MTLRFAAIVMFLMCLGGAARSDDRVLVVGVEDIGYLPAYAVQNGEYVGTARTIFDKFAADRGWRLVYRPLPIKRLFAELAGGGIDLKFPDNPYWNPTAKKGVAVTYSQPVIRYIDGAMVLPSRLGAEVKLLGCVAGFTPFAWQDRIKDGRVQLRENTNLDALLQQVLRGRLDGAYISVAAAHHRLDSVLGQPGGLVFDPGQPHSRDSYMLSSSKHPAVIAEFDAWMAANAGWVKAAIALTEAEKGVD